MATSRLNICTVRRGRKAFITESAAKSIESSVAQVQANGRSQLQSNANDGHHFETIARFGGQSPEG